MFVLGLTVFVDKRITLGAFKLKLEPYVTVQAENFKVSGSFLTLDMLGNSVCYFW